MGVAEGTTVAGGVIGAGVAVAGVPIGVSVGEG